MAGYKIQGKTANGEMVDIPLAAKYDASGNDIQLQYATKAEANDKLYAIAELLKERTFAGATWRTIKTIAEAGLAEMFWSVGDEKEIALSSGELVTMVILGFNHDDLADGSGKAGITLGTKNALDVPYSMSSDESGVEGWTNSSMRNSTMKTLYELLPDEVKSVIKSVNKVTATWSDDLKLETTADKLFLFSQEEIMGTNCSVIDQQNSLLGQGSQYEYFRCMPSLEEIFVDPSVVRFLSEPEREGTFYTEQDYEYFNKYGSSVIMSAGTFYNFNSSKALGNYGSEPYPWWLRSSDYSGVSSFCYITSDGCVNFEGFGAELGVVFGFCI